MKQSAGILLYRRVGKTVEVLLVHPGGPFWARKDLGSWSMPKGEFEESEEPLIAAKREFAEEVGSSPPEGAYRSLGEVKQSSGKIVHAFTLEADFNLERFQSNMFQMEWPPKSGQKQEFPENDKAAWVPLATAKQKVVKGQNSFLERLMEHLGVEDMSEGSAEQASLF
jgi:predicted NUDIX family NTP pyrophosphohydrolase